MSIDLTRAFAMEAAGLMSEPWARISRARSSDLAVERLTTAFIEAVSVEGISCKVIAGYHRNHIFAQWGRRGDSVAVLRRLMNA